MGYMQEVQVSGSRPKSKAPELNAPRKWLFRGFGRLGFIEFRVTASVPECRTAARDTVGRNYVISKR